MPSRSPRGGFAFQRLGDEAMRAPRSAFRDRIGDIVFGDK